MSVRAIAILAVCGLIALIDFSSFRVSDATYRNDIRNTARCPISLAGDTSSFGQNPFWRIYAFPGQGTSADIRMVPANNGCAFEIVRPSRPPFDGQDWRVGFEVDPRVFDAEGKSVEFRATLEADETMEFANAHMYAVLGDRPPVGSIQIGRVDGSPLELRFQTPIVEAGETMQFWLRLALHQPILTTGRLTLRDVSVRAVR